MAVTSSAQAARQALADRLREIRVTSGLNGRTLAAAANWHPTKVSKLEHAVTAPSVEDIRTWCALCGADDRASDLIASLVAADTMWTEWRRLERTGLRQANKSVVPLWEATRWFRIYSSCLIPGPVQHEGYIRALLTATKNRRGLTDDVEETVAVRVAKQKVVHGDRRFAIVVEESALRYRIGGARVLADQLRHLLEVMSLPSISLGVVPLNADRTRLRPTEMFFMFDEKQVSAEFVSGWLRITAPGEIALYAQAFQLLTSMAVHGDAARSLILASLEALGD
ncbi:helix-turn-helix domain-containing protein [Streptosporangium saharense]|uniref:helix-turn-helix domain-containing protein n=1 Tax=Streptosporangium saharense TaxID=1706840 RepID=UPI001621F2C2|nr:helix-turn-helix transcriptional regulator [Streptosporangium saharense]